MPSGVPLSTDEARAMADARHSHERGAVGRHVKSVVKRKNVLTDEEWEELGAIVAERTRADQGLPAKVEDAATLDRIATVLAEPAK